MGNETCERITDQEPDLPEGGMLGHDFVKSGSEVNCDIRINYYTGGGRVQLNVSKHGTTLVSAVNNAFNELKKLNLI